MHKGLEYLQGPTKYHHEEQNMYESDSIEYALLPGSHQTSTNGVGTWLTIFLYAHQAYHFIV